MEKLELLGNALSYIEENLQKDIKTENIAKECYCSKSSLEKIFKCINNISVHDYIIRRRMTIAARHLLNTPGINLLELALECGYSSNESFTRAFKNIWNCNPSEFTGRYKFSELFPKIQLPEINGGMMMKRKYDISELYDLFCQRRNCYFVCCDIKSLVPINEISFKAGDLAIIESMNRMNQSCGENDIVFRIGGDEFVMLTDSTDEAYANEICERIKAYNGNTFDYEGQKIPLNLHVAYAVYHGSNMKYNELFGQLQEAINCSK